MAADAVTRNNPLPPRTSELGPAWLAGDRGALATLAAQAADTALALPERAAAAAATLLAKHQAAERFVLRSGLAAQLGVLVDAPPVARGLGADELAVLAAAGLLESYGQWPSAARLAPDAMARLFARGLQAGCETAWLQDAIRAHGLAPPQSGGAVRPRHWPWAVRLRQLGAFECETATLPAVSGAKAPAKPIALLRLIALHEADGGVAAATVAQALWPGERREGREKALETTLARLRKLLGHADAILLHEQRLRLPPARVWCDWPALLQRLDRIEAAPRDNFGPGWDEVFALWRGPLLGEEADETAWPWRERLRNRLAAALLADAEMPGHAARYLRAFSLDPQLEARMRGPT